MAQVNSRLSLALHPPFPPASLPPPVTPVPEGGPWTCLASRSSDSLKAVLHQSTRHCEDRSTTPAGGQDGRRGRHRLVPLPPFTVRCRTGSPQSPHPIRGRWRMVCSSSRIRSRSASAARVISQSLQIQLTSRNITFRSQVAREQAGGNNKPISSHFPIITHTLRR